MTVAAVHPLDPAIVSRGSVQIHRWEMQVLLGLFLTRWFAGIIENFGVPMISEFAAIAMLGGLTAMFLRKMRVAKQAAVFVLGCLFWIICGAMSFSINSGAPVQPTIKLLALLALYAVFANAALTYLRGETALRHLSGIFGCFLTVGFVLSTYQLLSGTGFVEPGRLDIPRAKGSDIHPVQFGIQMVAAMVGYEICRLKLVVPFGRMQILINLLGICALYLTFARTAWIMALVLVIVPQLLRGNPARRIILGIVYGAAVVVLVASSNRFDDLQSLPNFLANFSVHDVVFDWRYIDNSVSWRIVNWSYGLQQAMQQPLFGHGPGQSAVSSYFNLEMHNIFLEVIFEGGVFGLSGLLVVLTGLWHIHRQLPGKAPRDRSSRMLANLFALVLLFAVTFSTSFVDQLMSFLLYVFMLAAASNAGNETRPRNNARLHDFI